MKFDGMPNKFNMTSIYVTAYNITTSSFSIVFTKGDYFHQQLLGYLMDKRKINKDIYKFSLFHFLCQMDLI